MVIAFLDPSFGPPQGCILVFWRSESADFGPSEVYNPSRDPNLSTSETPSERPRDPISPPHTRYAPIRPLTPPQVISYLLPDALQPTPFGTSKMTPFGPHLGCPPRIRPRSEQWRPSISTRRTRNELLYDLQVSYSLLPINTSSPHLYLYAPLTSHMWYRGCYQMTSQMLSK